MKFKMLMVLLCAILVCQLNPVIGEISSMESNFIQKMSDSGFIVAHPITVDTSTNELKIESPRLNWNPLFYAFINNHSLNISMIEIYISIQKNCPNINGCQYILIDNQGNAIGTMKSYRRWFDDLLWQSDGNVTNESLEILVDKTLNTFQKDEPSTYNNIYSEEQKRADQEYLKLEYARNKELKDKRDKEVEEWNNWRREEWAKSGTTYIPELSV